MIVSLQNILIQRNKIIYASEIDKIKPIIQNYYDVVSKSSDSSEDFFNYVKNQVQSNLQKGSNELNWFCSKVLTNLDYLLQFKNHSGKGYQIFNYLIQYSKLNKNKKKKIALNNATTVQQFQQFMKRETQKFINKFRQPKNAQKIFTPMTSNYNVYKCYVSNKKIQQQLQDITTIGIDQKGKKKHYTCWCVVNGTKPWGYLTQSPWNYYYYITTSDYKPYILMNFGDHGQINNIHDQTFSNWNDQLLDLVHYLMEKDNYNPKDNIEDGQIFNTKFNQMDYMQQIYNKKINVNNLKKINENNQYYLYEDQKNNKKIIVHGNEIIYFYDLNDLHRVGKQKLNKDIIDLLIKNNQYDIIGILIQDKIIQPQDKTLFEDCLQFICHDLQIFLSLVKSGIIDKKSDFFKNKMNYIKQNKPNFYKNKLEQYDNDDLK